MLLGAERPCILVGQGVRYGGACEELLKLAERLQIPVAASMSGLRDAIAARYETLAERAGVSFDSLQATVEGAVEAVEAHAKRAINAVGRNGAGDVRG